ncbi:MAG: hypothetical protein A7316_02895 [Candidatus Altiarchaeales archaeon WOR_SM1_86-2]|nr:MAG: hypothetical protein A7316_02895 [Candidatus Altiarchaeales archaeon WOR_SM1_86-2]ODS40826.1 MAG: hypothetical protein A7315_07615 [Candidatus Altiarchaeales archaeon WOR_SM1_79]
MIKGYYTKKGFIKRPFVDAEIMILDTLVEKPLRFLVDLGADFTIICEKDAHRLGLDYSKLKKADRDLGGIGGKAERYTMEVILKIEPDFVKRMNVSVIKNKIPDDISPVMRSKLKNFYERLPSLLGRDVIREFGLFVHERTERIYFLQDNEIPNELFEITKNK